MLCFIIQQNNLFRNLDEESEVIVESKRWTIIKGYKENNILNNKEFGY